MTYQVGDTRRPKLTVNPYDGSLIVTLTVVCQATGVATPTAVSGPVAGPNPGEGVWTANVPYTFTSPGLWVERWKGTNAVTGIGAGAENVSLDVEATPPPTGPGQTAAWATVTQYADIVGGALPADLPYKLRAATLTLRAETGLDLYVTTDPLVLVAMAEACCLQVKYAADNGWTTGSAGLERDVAIGSLRMGAAKSQTGSSSGVSSINPLALEVLAGVGLMSPVVTSQPVWWG